MGSPKAHTYFVQTQKSYKQGINKGLGMPPSPVLKTQQLQMHPTHGEADYLS